MPPAAVPPRWIRGPLNRRTADSVRALSQRALAADGVEPLSEATLLSLESGEGVRHLLARAGHGEAADNNSAVAVASGELVGYAQGRADLPAPAPGEAVVAPEARGRGVGGSLLDQLITVAPGVWAHGDLPAARELARQRRWQPLRTLLQLVKDLRQDEPAPPVKLPSGWHLRAYRGPADHAGLLEVNGRAFADLPDQGAWTEADLTSRVGSSWFDPAGLLILTEDSMDSDGSIVGFHWTKVHPDGVGEVYVIAVAPEAHGRGLGRVLLLAGLAHLRDRGCPQAILYVDDQNEGAAALYRSADFRVSRTDVVYGPVADAIPDTARGGQPTAVQRVRPESGRLEG